MSTGLKTISISKGAVEYLKSVLDSEPARSRSEMNKMNAVFRCVNPAFAAYQAERKAIRDKYAKMVEGKNNDGTPTKRLVIPAEQAEEHKKAQDDSTKEMTEISFDRESLVVVKRVCDGVFNRPEAKESGLAGSDQLGLFEEVMRAVYSALDLSYDDECKKDEEAASAQQDDTQGGSGAAQ